MIYDCFEGDFGSLDKLLHNAVDIFLQYNDIETLSDNNTVYIPFEYKGKNTFPIPKEIIVDIEFIKCWCENIMRYNLFSKNIILYLETSSLDNVDISIVDKDTYLSQEDFYSFCEFMSHSIEHINNSIHQFHFYD